MQAKKIVFPTDFSKTSKAALDFAESLARGDGGKIYILHVEEPPAAYGGGDVFMAIPTATLEDVKRMLLTIVPSDSEIAYEHHLVHGVPAEAIANFADSVSADLIVIGTHGRTGFKRMMLGSVAEAVVRHANCPVLSYKPKPPTAKAAS